MHGYEYIDDIPFYQLEKYPTDYAVNYKYLEEWHAFGTERICKEIVMLSNGLYRQFKGIQNIGIYARSGCPQWSIIDMAIMRSGKVSVPLHGNASDADILHIISDARIEILFVQFEDQLTVLQALEIKGLKVYGFEEDSDIPHYSTLFDDTDGELIQNRHPGDLATIIYTSGSTGLPKGVMLSHQNIMSNIKSLISLVPVHHRHVVASYLPLSHVFERVAIYVYMTVGAKIYYIDNPLELIKNLQDIRPHYITSVPRILEKVYDAILKGVKESNWVQRKIIKWALSSSRRARKQSINPLRRMELFWCDLIVFRKWRKFLGGRIKGVIVGAAAMPRHIAYLFNDAGIKVREGYGLTETSPVVSFNRFEPGGNRFGTVGIALPSVEVRIDAPDENGEGEVLVRGPNVMMGYYQNASLTAEKIDKDGWFHTGDVGQIVNKRFLRITDRKKDIFKTSSGLYVAPQQLEAVIRRNEFIDQGMVIGFNRPFITALIVPNFKILKNWCMENDIHWTAPQYMVLHPKVIKLYQEIIEEINSELKRHETIRRFDLIHHDWSVSSGEYTPTLKLKRKVILERYHKEIEKMYSKG